MSGMIEFVTGLLIGAIGMKHYFLGQMIAQHEPKKQYGFCRRERHD